MTRTKDWRILNLLIFKSPVNMPWLYMLTSNVLNAKMLISEEGRIVQRLWISLKMQDHLNLKNSFVLTVVRSQYKTAQNMEKTLFSLNVNFVAQQPNGFVGGTLIFVSRAIRSNVTEIMSVNIQKKNCQNVKDLLNAR